MDWSDVIISVVSVILTGLASWAVAKLTSFINSKIENTEASNMLTTAITTVTDVVKEVYQTYVESLKDSDEDVWTEEAQKKALSSALEKIKTMLPEATQTYVSSTFGDIDTWLTTQIEATIYTLKNNGNSEE